MVRGVAQMGLETRGNRLYYYRKRREGDRVVSEYVGAGALAQAMAKIDAQKRHERDAERAQLQAEREHFAEVDKLIDEAGLVVRTLTRATLQTSGFYRHKGQWRRRGD